MLTDAEIGAHLERTSRTFALAIPLLPTPVLTRQVSLAYLLFRLADSLEDAPLWHRFERAEALESFLRWLDAPSKSELALASAPSREAATVDLCKDAERLLGAIRGDARGDVIIAHTKRTARGMLEFVTRQDARGSLTLRSIPELRAYAYAVAGIVGELLTELFTEDATLKAKLMTDAAAFGEGLQLVNILKDAPADAREGRVYLPPTEPRSAVAALAREDLTRAERYVATLREAGQTTLIPFTELPLKLATATLDALDRGEPKLTRDAVLSIYRQY